MDQDRPTPLLSFQLLFSIHLKLEFLTQVTACVKKIFVENIAFFKYNYLFHLPQ